MRIPERLLAIEQRSIGRLRRGGVRQFVERYARALEIAWLGDAISAENALQWGLVNRLAEPEQLAQTTKDLASALARAATKGLVLTRRAMLAGMGQNLEAQLEYEALLQGIAGKTRDYAEGVKAFIEKRGAEFCGE